MLTELQAFEAILVPMRTATGRSIEVTTLRSPDVRAGASEAYPNQYVGLPGPVSFGGYMRVTMSCYVALHYAREEEPETWLTHARMLAAIVNKAAAGDYWPAEAADQAILVQPEKITSFLNPVSPGTGGVMTLECDFTLEMDVLVQGV